MSAVAMSANGLAIAYAGRPREPPIVVVKLARNAGNVRTLHREGQAASILREDPRLEGWTLAPPPVLATGHLDGWPWLAESRREGITAGALLARGANLAQITQLATTAVATLHRRTAEAITIGDRLLDRWIDVPAGAVATIVARSRKRTSALHNLARELRESLAGRTVTAGWVHGDCGLENILMQENGSAVTGIVDWELAWSPAPGIMDAALFVLSAYARHTRRPLAAIVTSMATKGTPTELFTAIEAAGHLSSDQALDTRTIVLLCWLHHVAASTAWTAPGPGDWRGPTPTSTACSTRSPVAESANRRRGIRSRISTVWLPKKGPPK